MTSDRIIREIGGTDGKAKPGAWFAEILGSAATVNDDLFVRIDGIDPKGQRGPCAWTPEAAAGGMWLPGGGENALVIFDSNKIPWIIKWLPDEDSVEIT